MRSLAIVAVAVCVACGGGQPSGPARPTTPASVAEHRRLVAAGDALWSQRGDAAKLRTAIARWQAAVDLDGSDVRTFEKLGRAISLLGNVGMAKASKAERAALFKRGAALAERGIAAASPAFARLRRQGAKMVDAIAVTERAAAPLVYWHAVNLGSYVAEVGVSAGIKYKDTIFKLMSHVLKVAPGYYDRGADRALGAFFAALPSFLGGDLARSKRHFDAAIKGAPNFLGNYVVMAEYYAVKKKDRALFDSLLAKVVAAKACVAGGPSPCVEPGLAVEAYIDKRQAEKLMAKRDSLF